MTVIVRADIESLVINYAAVQMAEHGDPVPGADELAAGAHTESFAIFRVGGVVRDRTIDAATLAVEAKGANVRRSSQILYLLLAILADLAGHDLGALGVIRVIEAGGPAWLPVSDSPTRYTATVVVEVQVPIT